MWKVTSEKVSDERRGIIDVDVHLQIIMLQLIHAHGPLLEQAIKRQRGI
jgi:hypothetical protein